MTFESEMTIKGIQMLRLPTHRSPTSPGKMLVHYLEGNMTQAELCKKLGCKPAKISEIVNDKRGISTEFACQLADVLGTTPEFWVNVQCAWELWHAKQNFAEAKMNAKVFTPQRTALDKLEKKPIETRERKRSIKSREESQAAQRLLA